MELPVLTPELRPHYVWRVFDCISQLANTALLRGDANESISGRSARIALWDNLDHKGWKIAYHTINALFFWQENHCYQAYINDHARAQHLVSNHQRRTANAG